MRRLHQLGERRVGRCAEHAGGAGNAGGRHRRSSTPDAAAEARSPSPKSRKFNEPWAMTFLPDGRLLVTEKKGALKLLDVSAAARTPATISGVPKVAYGGQGGLGDVVLHPQFASNGLVYLSYAEAGDGDTRGAAVRARKLTLDANGGGALSGPAGDLAAGAQGRRRRPLRPPHRVRPRRPAVDQLRRAPEVHSRAGHEVQPRQDRAPQRRRLAAGRQSVRGGRRRRRAGLVARPSQPARHRVRCAGPAVEHRDGARRAATS